jgi:hypothetical protein
MQGTNEWDSNEYTDQPSYVFEMGGFDSTYRYSQGCLRWALVERGSSTYTGWVLCYPDGSPITYADGNQSGSISVSASGTYITQ